MIEELLAYKRMPLWTAETMPEAVKRKHNTKEGTWGKITVLKGRLKFVEMSEEGEELAEHIFEAGQDNPFAQPQAWHRVEALTDDLSGIWNFTVGLRITSLRNTAAIQCTQRFWKPCRQSDQGGRLIWAVVKVVMLFFWPSKVLK